MDEIEAVERLVSAQERLVRMGQQHFAITTAIQSLLETVSFKTNEERIDLMNQRAGQAIRIETGSKK